MPSQSNCSIDHCHKSRVSSLCMAGVAGLQSTESMEDLVVAGRHTPNFTNSSRRSPNITRRPSSHRRPLPLPLPSPPNHPNHRQDPPPERQLPHPSMQPHTIGAILPLLRLNLTKIVVRPHFPFPSGFRFWLHKGFTEQCSKTLGME
jgi:hypothetical protein